MIRQLQLLDRVDPPLGVGSAAPAKLARRARPVREPRVEQDRPAQAEAVGRLAHRVDAFRQVVLQHPFDRLAAQQAHTFQLAAVQQHLAEAEVIPGRGDQPAAAKGLAGGLGDIVPGFDDFQPAAPRPGRRWRPGGSTFSGGTQKAVSGMPSGAKMCSWRYSSKSCPEANWTI